MSGHEQAPEEARGWAIPEAAAEAFTPVAVAEERPPRRFVRHSLDDLAAIPEAVPIVRGLVNRESLIMLAGESGAGKTFVAMDLIGAMLAGETFAGRFETPEPVTVAYAAGEKPRGLNKRFRAMRHQRGMGPDAASRLGVYLRAPQLFDDQSPDAVAAFVAELREDYPDGLDVLFIDTVNTATVGAEENSNSDTGVIVAKCKEIIEALRCVIVLIHHTGKVGGGRDPRGASAWIGGVEAVYMVEKPPEAGVGRLRFWCRKAGEEEPFREIDGKLVPLPEFNSVALEWLGSPEREARPVSAAQVALDAALTYLWQNEHRSQETGIQYADLFEKLKGEKIADTTLRAAISKAIKDGDKRLGKGFAKRGDEKTKVGPSTVSVIFSPEWGEPKGGE